MKARNGALLPDTTGQAWHFVPEVWAGGGGTLSFVQTFDKDEVTVAMKTPFTLEDEKALCVEAAKCPDAKVIRDTWAYARRRRDERFMYDQKFQARW